MFTWSLQSNVRTSKQIIKSPLRPSTIKNAKEGPVKLIKRVKIAHSFLQSVSDQFHVIILSLPMYFYKWLSKNFSKPTSKNGDMDRFHLKNHF